jgi:ABC-type ATPase with predicted acetyltransferase domain
LHLFYRGVTVALLGRSGLSNIVAAESALRELIPAARRTTGARRSVFRRRARLAIRRTHIALLDPVMQEAVATDIIQTRRGAGIRFIIISIVALFTNILHAISASLIR